MQNYAPKELARTPFSHQKRRPFYTRFACSQRSVCDWAATPGVSDFLQCRAAGAPHAIRQNSDCACENPRFAAASVAGTNRLFELFACGSDADQAARSGRAACGAEAGDFSGWRLIWSSLFSSSHTERREGTEVTARRSDLRYSHFVIWLRNGEWCQFGLGPSDSFPPPTFPGRPLHFCSRALNVGTRTFHLTIPHSTKWAEREHPKMAHPVPSAVAPPERHRTPQYDSARSSHPYSHGKSRRVPNGTSATRRPFENGSRWELFRDFVA